MIMIYYLWNEHKAKSATSKDKYQSGRNERVGIGVVFHDNKYRTGQNRCDEGDKKSVGDVLAFRKFGRQIPGSPCLEEGEAYQTEIHDSDRN